MADGTGSNIGESKNGEPVEPVAADGMTDMSERWPSWRPNISERAVEELLGKSIGDYRRGDAPAYGDDLPKVIAEAGGSEWLEAGVMAGVRPLLRGDLRRRARASRAVACTD